MQRRIRLGATDGSIRMPDGTDHYIFGFTDLTGVPDAEIFQHRGLATLLAPLLNVAEGDEVFLTMTNLGLPQRPDLADSHTIHWHGFPNQIPLWDGVPEASLAVPPNRDFVYHFIPRDPGTYMYHCHFEPVEHIQMGMVGPLIVRPQLGGVPENAGRHFAYNDPATEYDREFFLLLTELDPVAHSQIQRVQEFDWTEYRPHYWLVNGRTYPQTTLRNNHPSLPLQPYGTRIRANEGERVLLRVINLGYQQHALQILGIPLRVVGMDAQQVRGTGGEDLARLRDVLFISAGQTADVIFTAPARGRYPLFNRGYHKNLNAGAAPGGMMTEVRIYPPGRLAAQRRPNQ